jgi:hypothetical protein
MVPQRLKDLMERGLTPPNIFQNHEVLEGGKMCDFLHSEPEAIEENWKANHAGEVSTIVELLDESRLAIFKELGVVQPDKAVWPNLN